MKKNQKLMVGYLTDMIESIKAFVDNILIIFHAVITLIILEIMFIGHRSSKIKNEDEQNLKRIDYEGSQKTNGWETH